MEFPQTQNKQTKKESFTLQDCQVIEVNTRRG